MYRKESMLFWFATIVFTLSLSMAVPRSAGAAAPKGKPMIPVQVTIGPTAAKLKPQDIRSGDVVELTVTVAGVRGADETAVKIRLEDGAEPVSGDLAWSGRLSPKETKQLVISVRAPAKGVGKVVAEVSALRQGKVVMAKQTVYTLGAPGISVKGKSAHGMRKDSKGREVIEY